MSRCRHQPDTLWLYSTGTGTLSNVVARGEVGWFFLYLLATDIWSVCSVAHWDKPEVRAVQQTLFIPGHWQSGNPESHHGDKHWLSAARSRSQDILCPVSPHLPHHHHDPHYAHPPPRPDLAQPRPVSPRSSGPNTQVNRTQISTKISIPYRKVLYTVGMVPR